VSLSRRPLRSLDSITTPEARCSIEPVPYIFGSCTEFPWMLLLLLSLLL
jgi:hypothetical protein